MHGSRHIPGTLRTAMSAVVAVAPGTTGPLSVAKVVADAQEKTKGYLPRIEVAVEDPGQCIEESHLDKEAVGYSTRTVGKVWLDFGLWLCHALVQTRYLSNLLLCLMFGGVAYADPVTAVAAAAAAAAAMHVRRMLQCFSM